MVMTKGIALYPDSLGIQGVVVPNNCPESFVFLSPEVSGFQDVVFF